MYKINYTNTNTNIYDQWEGHGPLALPMAMPLTTTTQILQTVVQIDKNITLILYCYAIEYYKITNIVFDLFSVWKSHPCNYIWVICCVHVNMFVYSLDAT